MPWNNPTDTNRIIQHLGLGALYIEYDIVVSQQDAITTKRPDIIPLIQADLDTLDTLDASLTTEQGSTAGALIRADVLEWEGGGAKTAGISQRYDAIRRRVANMMSLEVGAGSGGGGGFGSGCLKRG